MKYLFTIIISLVSFVATANVQFPTGYEQVPEERMPDYLKAISINLMAKPYLVQGCNNAWVTYTLNNAAEILISKNSSQPLLLINAYSGGDDEVLNRLIIETDPSLKNIVTVVGEGYLKEETNTGDLANPVFAFEFVLKQKAVCTFK